MNGLWVRAQRSSSASSGGVPVASAACSHVSATPGGGLAPKASR